MPCVSHHKTFLGLHTPYVCGHDSSHDGLQLLPHDRDCPQANLVLRGWVWDSHHPVGGYLPSYLIVGASLQKVNAENKSLLACHLLKLL
jgi:hypothetical protein